MMEGERTAVAIVGEYDPTHETHVATDDALTHSSRTLDSAISGSWISTEAIDRSLFDKVAGIWIAPGSPYKNMEKTLWAIKHARENRIPCFGTCGGFQHMVLEYARNCLELRDAQHAEYDPYSSRLFISQLECSLVGRKMDVRLVAGSRAAEIYGAHSVTERYYCNFGVSPAYVDRLKSGPLHVTGSDAEGDVRIIELPDHPYFIGTLFVPQARSTPENPHPLVTGFLQAVLDKAA